MPTKRLPMRQLREILRLHLHSQLGVRQIHRTLRVSVGSVSKIVKQAHEQQLDWQAICQLDDVKQGIQGQAPGNTGTGTWEYRDRHPFSLSSAILKGTSTPKGISDDQSQKTPCLYRRYALLPYHLTLRAAFFFMWL